jgi:hypothetical protein
VSSSARSLGRSGLDEAERECVAALGTGRIPPFLGHHEMADAIVQGLSYESRRGVGRIETRLRLLFYLWPALTITWIARTVAECYGSDSPNAVYPILASLLGVDELEPDSRRRIAGLFRHACRRLDLPFPGEGSPPDLYVVQGGVPHSQVALLVDALTRAERRLGLPDVDDDMAVAAFTERAADLVDVHHPVYARFSSMIRLAGTPGSGPSSGNARTICLTTFSRPGWRRPRPEAARPAVRPWSSPASPGVTACSGSISRLS